MRSQRDDFESSFPLVLQNASELFSDGVAQTTGLIPRMLEFLAAVVYCACWFMRPATPFRGDFRRDAVLHTPYPPFRRSNAIFK